MEICNRHEVISFEVQSGRTFDNSIALEKRLGAGTNFQPIGRQGKAADTLGILTLNVTGLPEMCGDVAGVC